MCSIIIKDNPKMFYLLKSKKTLLDFSSFLSKSTGGRPSANHQLTIPMAKETTTNLYKLNNELLSKHKTNNLK